MPPIIDVERSFTVGQDTYVSSVSPTQPCAVIFENNTETGYFYVLDLSPDTPVIQDALHIYNVAQVVDREAASTLAIIWTADGFQAILLINGHPHAAVDFGRRRSCCRTGFPPPNEIWPQDSHAWDESLLLAFRSEDASS